MYETDPQRFTVLKMTGKLMDAMRLVDEEASVQVERITQRLLHQNPMPQTDDILEKTRYFNAQKYVAEELVINEMVLVAR